MHQPPSTARTPALTHRLPTDHPPLTTDHCPHPRPPSQAFKGETLSNLRRVSSSYIPPVPANPAHDSLSASVRSQMAGAGHRSFIKATIGVPGGGGSGSGGRGEDGGGAGGVGAAGTRLDPYREALASLSSSQIGVHGKIESKMTVTDVDDVIWVGKTGPGITLEKCNEMTER